MEELSFSVDWNPIIRGGGTALTTAVGALLAYKKLRGLVPTLPGTDPEQKLERKVEGALDAARVLSSRLVFELHDSIKNSRLLKIEETQLKLKDRSLGKSEKARLFGELGKATITWFLVIPYLRAIITTTLSLRVASALIIQDDKEKVDGTSSSGSAAPPGMTGVGFLDGGIAKMLEALTNAGTVFSDKRALPGLQVYATDLSRQLSDILEQQLLPVAREAVLQHFTDENGFKVVESVPYDKFKTTFYAAWQDFEKSFRKIAPLSKIGSQINLTNTRLVLDTVDEQFPEMQGYLAQLHGGGGDQSSALALPGGGVPGGTDPADPFAALLGPMLGGVGSDPFGGDGGRSQQLLLSPEQFEKQLSTFKDYLEEVDSISCEIICTTDSFKSLMISQTDLEMADLWSPPLEVKERNYRGSVGLPNTVFALFQGTKNYSVEKAHSANVLQLSTAMLAFVKQRHNPPSVLNNTGDLLELPLAANTAPQSQLTVEEKKKVVVDSPGKETDGHDKPNAEEEEENDEQDDENTSSSSCCSPVRDQSYLTLPELTRAFVKATVTSSCQ